MSPQELVCTTSHERLLGGKTLPALTTCSDHVFSSHFSINDLCRSVRVLLATGFVLLPLPFSFSLFFLFSSQLELAGFPIAQTLFSCSGSPRPTIVSGTPLVDFFQASSCNIYPNIHLSSAAFWRCRSSTVFRGFCISRLHFLIKVRWSKLNGWTNPPYVDRTVSLFCFSYEDSICVSNSWSAFWKAEIAYAKYLVFSRGTSSSCASNSRFLFSICMAARGDGSDRGSLAVSSGGRNQTPRFPFGLWNSTRRDGTLVWTLQRNQTDPKPGQSRPMTSTSELEAQGTND